MRESGFCSSICGRPSLPWLGSGPPVTIPSQFNLHVVPCFECTCTDSASTVHGYWLRSVGLTGLGMGNPLSPPPLSPNTHTHTHTHTPIKLGAMFAVFQLCNYRSDRDHFLCRPLSYLSLMLANGSPDRFDVSRRRLASLLSLSLSLSLTLSLSLSLSLSLVFARAL